LLSPEYVMEVVVRAALDPSTVVPVGLRDSAYGSGSLALAATSGYVPRYPSVLVDG